MHASDNFSVFIHVTEAPITAKSPLDCVVLFVFRSLFRLVFAVSLFMPITFLVMSAVRHTLIVAMKRVGKIHDALSRRRFNVTFVGCKSLDLSAAYVSVAVSGSVNCFQDNDASDDVRNINKNTRMRRYGDCYVT
jgi:hypothetical protein